MKIYGDTLDPMLRFYRCILVAIAGLIIAGAAPPNESKPSASASYQQLPSTLVQNKYAPHPDKYAEACYHAEDHDSADLCAQWRAAIAAEKAVDASVWSNWISGGGAILSFVSIVLVVVALGQNRRANRIAQEGLEVQSRPLVVFDGPLFADRHGGVIDVSGRLTNKGNGPLQIISIDLIQHRETRPHPQPKESGEPIRESRAEASGKVFVEGESIPAPTIYLESKSLTFFYVTFELIVKYRNPLRSESLPPYVTVADFEISPSLGVHMWRNGEVIYQHDGRIVGDISACEVNGYLPIKINHAKLMT